MASRWKVQRGRAFFGASTDTTTVTIDAVDTTRAFPRLTNSLFSSIKSSITTSDKNNDDLGMTVELTNSTTLTFTRESSGEDENYTAAWEVIESHGGGDGMIVRDHSIHTIPDGDVALTVDGSGFGVLDNSQVAVFLTSVRSEATTAEWASSEPNITWDSNGDIVLFRGFSTGDLHVGVAVVEFGAAWTVQSFVHTFSSTDIETESITAVANTTKSLIVYSKSNGLLGNNDADLGWMIWMTAADELSMDLAVNSNFFFFDPQIRGFVLEHKGLEVRPFGTETTSESAPGDADSEVDYTIPGDALTAREFGTGVGTNGGYASVFLAIQDSDIAANYPEPFWNYRLSDASTFKINRSRVGTNGLFEAQIALWPTYGPRQRRIASVTRRRRGRCH